MFGVCPLILILSLAADLAEELKRSRGRREEEPEKRGGRRSPPHHKWIWQDAIMSGNVRSVCWGSSQGLRDVSCLGRS